MRRMVIAGMIIGLFILPAVVSASALGWWVVSGNAGVVESSATVLENHFRDGTDVGLSAGVSDARMYIPLQVHMKATEAINRVSVSFYTTPNLQVDSIEIWDGGTTVQTIPGPWTGSNNLTLGFPKYRFVKGLCIRLRMTNVGVSTEYLRLTSAGAKVVTFP